MLKIQWHYAFVDFFFPSKNLPENYIFLKDMIVDDKAAAHDYNKSWAEREN